MKSKLYEGTSNFYNKHASKIFATEDHEVIDEVKNELYDLDDYMSEHATDPSDNRSFPSTVLGRLSRDNGKCTIEMICVARSGYYEGYNFDWVMTFDDGEGECDSWRDFPDTEDKRWGRDTEAEMIQEVEDIYEKYTDQYAVAARASSGETAYTKIPKKEKPGKQMEIPFDESTTLKAASALKSTLTENYKRLMNVQYRLVEEYGEGEGTPEIPKITVGRNVWFLKKIDSTHFKMSNELSGIEKGWVYHVGEIRNTTYYNDVKSWLHGGEDINGREYRDVNESLAEGPMSYYEVAYYAKIGEHGTAGSYKTMDEAYQRAIQLYKEDFEQGNIDRENEEDSDTQYIGVESDTDDFAIIYVTDWYINNKATSMMFDDQNMRAAWIKVATEVSNTGTPMKGSYSNTTETVTEAESDTGFNPRSGKNWSAFNAVPTAEDSIGEDLTEEALEAWAFILKAGLYQSLQGFFGRELQSLINRGLIGRGGHINWDKFDSMYETAFDDPNVSLPESFSKSSIIENYKRIMKVRS